MTIHRIYGLISPHFRKARRRIFECVMQPTPSKTILDVGGTQMFWSESDFRGQVTLLNTELDRFGNAPVVGRQVVGDGCALPFPDGSFDIVFSNSVIEHVGTWERQVKFADEARRVGRKFWIQTPAREFFIEPHLIAPFVHWLPRTWQRRLIRNFTPRGWLDRPGPAQVEEFLNEVRLISYAEMRQLFPGCRIIRERFLGMCKSYVAVKAAD
jgi:SAM-dependent methyltransferase